MDASLLSLAPNPAAAQPAAASNALAADPQSGAEAGEEKANSFAGLLIAAEKDAGAELASAKPLTTAELEAELVSNLTVAQEISAAGSSLRTDLPPAAQEVLKSLAPVLSHPLSPSESKRLLAAFREFSNGDSPSERLKALLEEAASEPGQEGAETPGELTAGDGAVTVEDVVTQWLMDQTAARDAKETAAATLQRIVQWLQQSLPPQEEVLAQANALTAFPDETPAPRTKEKEPREDMAILIPGWVPPAPATGLPATNAETTVNMASASLPEVRLPQMQAEDAFTPLTESSETGEMMIASDGEEKTTAGMSPVTNSLATDAQSASASRPDSAGDRPERTAEAQGNADFRQQLEKLAKDLSATAERDSMPESGSLEAADTTTSSISTATTHGKHAFEALRIHTPATPAVLHRADVAEQVHVALKQAVREGVDQITVQLMPEDLGRIEVKLELGQDAVTRVSFLVDKQHTFDLIQRDAAQLERMLQDAGVRADAGSMQFNLRQESQSKEPFANMDDEEDEGDTRSVSSLGKTELPTQTYLHLVSDRVDIHA